MTNNYTEELKKKYLQCHQAEIRRLNAELFMLIIERIKRIPLSPLEILGILEGLKSYFLFDVMREYERRLTEHERKKNR